MLSKHTGDHQVPMPRTQTYIVTPEVVIQCTLSTARETIDEALNVEKAVISQRFAGGVTRSVVRLEGNGEFVRISIVQ